MLWPREASRCAATRAWRSGGCGKPNAFRESLVCQISPESCRIHSARSSHGHLNGGRHYYDRCYLEGRVDFLFGNATAVFDHCTIRSKNGGYVTAASTPAEKPFGYVFLDCTLTGEGVKAYLGRPWRDYSAVAFLNTEMAAVVRAEGWHNWDKP